MTTLITSEIRKVTTLKFWWALAIPPVFVGICASAIAASIANSTSDYEFELSGGFGIVGLYVALGFTIMFVAVFGAVNGGTEFRYDTITTSFLTSTSRDRVIAAKLGVTALFALGYGLLVEIVSLVCLLLFSSEPFVLSGAVIGMLAMGLFAVVVWSLIGAGLGLLMGSPTWPAIIIVAWYPIGELVATSIVSGIGLGNISVVTPSALTLATVSVGEVESEFFMPWPVAPFGLLVWGLAIAGVGWLRTRERDIS